MTTPRFPARGTAEYWEFLEHWLMVERVDNDRQWRYLRRISAQLSGLNPVQHIVDLNFQGGSGSGRGSGRGSGSGSGHGSFNWDPGTCCFRFTCAGVVTCSGPNGTFTVRRSSHSAENRCWFQANFSGTDSLYYDGSTGCANSCQARYDRDVFDRSTPLCDGNPHVLRLGATDGFSTGWPVTITLFPIDCP